MPNLFVGRIQSSAPTQASVGIVSASVVSANENRVGLVLTNISTSTIYLGFSGNAAVVGSGKVLLPNGGTWTMDEYSYTKEAVNAISQVAATSLAVQEFTT